MSQEAQNIMQTLRNKAETQSHGWTAFKAATALGYEAAYKKQTDALNDVKKNMELDNERCWLVFTFLWGLVTAGAAPVTASLSSWAGRLIGEAKEAVALADELLDKTFETMKDKGQDQITDLLKDSLLEKKAGAAEDSRPWTPVGDSPYTYEKKMELMLEKLAVEIMRPLDELVDRASSWSYGQAFGFSISFEGSCPYMTDLPDDLGPSFIKKVQDTAELGMWIEWAAARDEPWWRKENQEISIGNEMKRWDPVLDRLWDLHVSLNDVTTVQRVGGTTYNRGEAVLDMVKLIRWAKRNTPLTFKELEIAKAAHLLSPKLRSRDQLRSARAR